MGSPAEGRQAALATLLTHPSLSMERDLWPAGDGGLFFGLCGFSAKPASSAFESRDRNDRLSFRPARC